MRELGTHVEWKAGKPKHLENLEIIRCITMEDIFVHMGSSDVKCVCVPVCVCACACTLVCMCFN